MKATPLLLPVFVATALGSIYFLPSAGEVAQSAVKMELPGETGGWHFRKQLPSQEELETLAKDTEFSKAICLRARPGEFDSEGRMIADVADVSVVLSGADINNSIHRPERCMPAQGHTILSSTDHTIELGNGRTMEVKRLRSKQRRPTNEARTEFVEPDCLTYYYFVGHDRITNDHLGRTFVDMKDRVLKGMDQRWAYVSSSMLFGDLVGLSEAEAEAKLTDFVKRFAEEQIKWDQVKP
jgi:hypothetical protein